MYIAFSLSDAMLDFRQYSHEILHVVYSLVPRLLHSFLSHTLQKVGREPGRFYPMQDDLVCVVLCVDWVSELSPTHTVFELLTVVDTESPSCLSQQLVLLVYSTFRTEELFVVASQGLLPAIFE